MIKPEEVAQYLQDHPDFFAEHPTVLDAIHLSHLDEHADDDRVISITQRQVMMLRKKNELLQDRLLALIDIGEQNDAIGEKMHRLVVALLGFNSLGEMLHGLQYHLCEDFSIPHVALRLWQTEDLDPPLPASVVDTVSDQLRIVTAGLLHPRCGTEVDDEIRQWFGNDAHYLQSFALIPLKKTQHFGLLVLSSPELERFYPDMGTLYLTRLGELASSSVIRLMRQPIEMPSGTDESIA
ncbi:MAG: DUF484 family protein [Nitrosomonas sp.]|nr:DUF484 family protein [Nitrosomonas sp.]